MTETPAGWPSDAVAPPMWPLWEHIGGSGHRRTARSPLAEFVLDYRYGRTAYRCDPAHASGYALGLLHGYESGRRAARKEKTP